MTRLVLFYCCAYIKLVIFTRSITQEVQNLLAVKRSTAEPAKSGGGLMSSDDGEPMSSGDDSVSSTLQKKRRKREQIVTKRTDRLQSCAHMSESSDDDDQSDDEEEENGGDSSVSGGDDNSNNDTGTVAAEKTGMMIISDDPHIATRDGVDTMGDYHHHSNYDSNYSTEKGDIHFTSTSLPTWFVGNNHTSSKSSSSSRNCDMEDMLEFEEQSC